MSRKIEHNVIANASIYIDGTSFIGRAEEIKLPDISMVVQERKVLGIIGKLELPYGFDKLEGEIKWNSIYKEAAKIIANPFKRYLIQARASVMTFADRGRSREVPLMTELLVMFKKSPLGTLKHLENMDMQSDFSCTYVRQVFDGEEILKLDIENNIFMVDGQDMLTDFRTNTGS